MTTGATILLVAVIVVGVLLAVGKYLYRKNNLDEEGSETLEKKKEKLSDAIADFHSACENRRRVLDKLAEAKDSYKGNDGAIKFEYLTDEFRIEKKKELETIDAKIRKNGKYILKVIPNHTVVEVGDRRVYKNQDYESWATITTWWDLCNRGKWEVEETMKVDYLWRT